MYKRILGLVLVIQVACSAKDPFSNYQLAHRPEQADQGQIKAVLVMYRGEVSIESANGHRFAAQPALPLLANDQIEVKNNSFAIVHLHNNHVVRLDEDLRLEVSNLAMFNAQKTSAAVAQQLTNLLKPEDRNQPERIVGWHARMQAAQTVTSLRESDKKSTQPKPEDKEVLVSKLAQQPQTHSAAPKKEPPERIKTVSRQPKPERATAKKPKKALRIKNRIKGNLFKEKKKAQKISRKFIKPAIREDQQVGPRTFTPKGAPTKKLRRAMPKSQNPTVSRWRYSSDRDWKQPTSLPVQIKRLFQRRTVIACLRKAPSKANKLQVSLHITNNLISQVRVLDATTSGCLLRALQKQKMSGMPDTTIIIEVRIP